MRMQGGNGSNPRRSRFRCHGLFRSHEGGLERVPGQARALHADRELRNAGERGELAEDGAVRGVPGIAGYHAVELREQSVGLLRGPPPQRLGHHRGRRPRDRAALPDEARVRDPAAVEADVQLDAIPAQRVVPGRSVRRVGHRAEVPRALAVVEDDLLVELAHAGRHTASWTASALGSRERTSWSSLMRMEATLIALMSSDANAYVRRLRAASSSIARERR